MMRKKIMVQAAEFISAFNNNYMQKHKAFENNFWAVKMNISGNSRDALNKTQTELEDFMGDKSQLPAIQSLLDAPAKLLADEVKCLQIFKRTIELYSTPDNLKYLRDKIMKLESDLGQHAGTQRHQVEIDGSIQTRTVGELRTLVATHKDEAVRKRAHECLQSIGPYQFERFCEIIKLRNQFAKKQGFEDFYDMKVSKAEGMSKKKLFEILDELEVETRPLMEQYLANAEAKHGLKANFAWNRGFYKAGGGLPFEATSDPYFPFENAVDSWARSFAALGISYKKSIMQLDLLDRQGKYPNGFCHWPVPAYNSPEGFVPTQTNFTSLANPRLPGSGKKALETLMHEGI